MGNISSCKNKQRKLQIILYLKCQETAPFSSFFFFFLLLFFKESGTKYPFFFPDFLFFKPQAVPHPGTAPITTGAFPWAQPSPEWSSEDIQWISLRQQLLRNSNGKFPDHRMVQKMFPYTSELEMHSVISIHQVLMIQTMSEKSSALKGDQTGVIASQKCWLAS